MTRTAGVGGALGVGLAAVAVWGVLHGGASPASPAPPPAPARETVPLAWAAGAHVTRARPAVVPRYGVFEHTFRAPGTYGNPWEQVRLTVQFSSPSRRRYTIGGFYYGGNAWKARFAPAEVGRWTWRAQLTDGRSTSNYTGVLRVTRSRNPGFVRRSPYNPLRWTFSDGSPYYPLGIGDCVALQPRESSPLDRWGLDGGFRPPGVHTDGRQVGIDTYMRAYSRAGVNLFRWSVDNCSFPLYQTISPSGNVYLAQGGIWGDQLVQHLRRHGFHVYMAFFNRPPFAGEPTPVQLAAIERYVRYVVDRWGAYVDFWELMNESNASPAWYQAIGSYLRSVDPYRHPISTSWEQPQLPVIDIDSPHWYENESQYASDADTWRRITDWERSGKPVVVGEQGNQGRSWYPDSAVRMRLRAWTAFFAQGTLIFWNASFAKDDVGNAIYLGPQERGYIHVLQRFTSGFDRRATFTGISVSEPAVVRAYALSGPRTYAAYIVASSNHTTPTRGLTVIVHPRRSGWARWVNPTTGSILARQRVTAGIRRLPVPPFTTDVALSIGG